MKEKDPLAVDPLEIVVLDRPEKFTYVSSLLSNEEKEQLQRVLLRNIDVFAWNHSDMIGIDPVLASHKLNIIPSAKICKIESEVFPLRSPSDYSDRGRQSSKSRFHQRGKVSRMACQCGGGSKKER